MITINNLTFSYPSSPPLLQDFNLQIQKGSLFGLLGPNGAGKTTLISLIAGMLSPWSGEVTIAGKRYPENKQEIYQGISVVPQEYAFYGQMTAYENLSFFSHMYPENKTDYSEQINKVIKLTGLEEYKHRFAKHFSGGLKRRLNLAIGLLNNPGLLILDEPTTGIDPQSRHFILQAIKDLNEQGTTVLYTSHYMEEIEQLCDDIAIMDHGSILVAGTLDQLLHSDSMVYINVENQNNNHTLHVEVKNFLQDHHLTFEGGCISGLLDSSAIFYILMNTLKTHDIPVESVRYGRQSLESLFFQLTSTHLRDV